MGESLSRGPLVTLVEASQEIILTVVEMRRPLMMNNGMNGPRLYRCFECDSAFDTKTNLETHMREGHKDKFCDECEDEFSWPDESHDCYYTRYSLRYIAGDIVPSF